MKDFKVDVPVLLIFFARPETLEKVFESIREARPSTLLLWQDGPREGREDDVENIQKCREIAENIDAYFTRFGYKVNSLKLPNQTGRRYFNYVEIGKSEIIGYPNSKGCPAEAMEIINNIYRNGVTLWHDHERIGNFTENTINT